MLRSIAITIAIAALLVSGGVFAAPGDSDGAFAPGLQMFGKHRPFSISDLPRGRLRDRIKSLPWAKRNRALEWLHRFDFPRKDLDAIEVDDEGAVFYADPAPAFCAGPQCDDQDAPRVEALEPTAGPTTPAAAAVSTDDAFLLHSRPGAPNVVFLDFDGHSFSNTAWGSGTFHGKAFDLDGNPSTFSEAERTAIAEIWHRVAEDFAPFDIDVTTEAPPSFGPFAGRVLITSKTQTNGNAMPHDYAGGVAYVGVWGRSDYASYYSPALVYYDNLASYPTYIAEACSHEFGHNLGLSHDGTSSVTYYAGHGNGATSWAPIMGNSYNRNVTQWSKGEYAGANNTQDDIAMLKNALFLVPDDHANNQAGATALSIDSNGMILVTDPETDPHNIYPQNKGVIDSVNDWDYFSFYAEGPINITIKPAWQAFYRDSRRGSNLDVRALLLDGSGNILAESDPAADTAAAISTSVSAGTKFLAITGIGSANAPSYGSQGQYYISGTVTASPNTPPTAAFSFACQALTCSFVDASSDSDGSIVAWSWDFGDGASSTSRNPDHAYATPGSYTVTLTVTDNAGATSVTQESVTVSSASDVSLTVGVTDGGAYGNGYGTNQHLTELTATFQGTGSDLTLSVTGYDIDYVDEVAVYLNNNLLGYLSKGPNNGLNSGDSFSIPAAAQLSGQNTLRFVEKTAGWIWGVTKLLVAAAGAQPNPDVSLTVGTQDPGAYGNGYGSNQNTTELTVGFQGTGTNLTLSVTGYDIDYVDEVAVYLNNNLLGYLSEGPNNGLNSGNSFSIPAAAQLSGQNTLRFVEKTSGWIWGVTGLVIAQ